MIYMLFFSSHGMFDGKEDDETQLINARKQESLVSVTVDWRELQCSLCFTESLLALNLYFPLAW